MRTSSLAVLVSCIGIGIVACGTLLDIQPDTPAPDASTGSDATTTDAPDEASATDAADESTASDGALDGSPPSCGGQEAGVQCQSDGAVCFSDSTCGACLGSTGTCHASGECCNNACQPFDTSIGTCGGACSAVGTACSNTVCCLPYRCTDAGANSMCVQ